MYCPLCHAEYRAGFTECSDCHVTLVEIPQRALPTEQQLAHVERRSNGRLLVASALVGQMIATVAVVEFKVGHAWWILAVMVISYLEFVVGIVVLVRDRLHIRSIISLIIMGVTWLTMLISFITER